MTARASIVIDGQRLEVPEGINVAAAIAMAGQSFRRSVTGQRRFPLCGMGVCFECRVCIDGIAQQRACMVPVRDGMQVRTDG